MTPRTYAPSVAAVTPAAPDTPVVILRVVASRDVPGERALLAYWRDPDGQRTDQTILTVENDGPIAVPDYWHAVIGLVVDTYTDHVHRELEGHA